MLLLALAALMMPAVFQLIHGGGLPHVGADERATSARDLEHLSLGVAIMLLVDLRRRPVLLAEDAPRPCSTRTASEHDEEEHAWPVRRAAIYAGDRRRCGGRDVGDPRRARSRRRREDIGLSQFFVGVFVVAIVGNAAEHWVAVLVARKDKMDLAVNIAIGSSAQIALFVAPVLVLLSFVFGPHPMALVFNGYELGALLFAVLIGNLVTQEGESNWFEGVQLLSLYAVFGLVFYFA